MDITSLTYGVNVPLTSAIYQALVYVSGPLAPYLCFFMIIGIIFTIWFFYKKTDIIYNTFLTYWNKLFI